MLPLVLDGDGRLYLHRYFDLECRLARRLLAAAQATALPASAIATLRPRLDQLFGASSDDAEVDWQKLAAALALRGRLSVISGGPGTGKTSTLVKLLACLFELDPDCRVALAAPTGKAAARMSEAIAQRASLLPLALRERMPTESYTVHRLLGFNPSKTGFEHHAGKPLAIDALVVDEASMLDLALATQLLEAVPPHARIILLGDKDQLSAVESGAVFSDLSGDPSLSSACKAELAALSGTLAERIEPPAATRQSSLRDSTLWFSRNFRFGSDSAIARLAQRVRDGEAQAAVQELERAQAGVHWIADGQPRPAPQTLELMRSGYAAYVRSVASADAAQAHQAFASYRVLCALREGPRGVQAVNAALGTSLRAAMQALDGGAPADPASPWYVGRPVLVLRNDALLKLFNGDIGIALRDASGQLMVHFPDGHGGFRAVAPVRLPPHETAFAMTVHKSQGSEFDAVMLLLPDKPHRVLSRELLYTAITRARSELSLCATAEVLQSAIHSATQRSSGLLARLREIAPDPAA